MGRLKFFLFFFFFFKPNCCILTHFTRYHYLSLTILFYLYFSAQVDHHLKQTAGWGDVFIRVVEISYPFCIWFYISKIVSYLLQISGENLFSQEKKKYVFLEFNIFANYRILPKFAKISPRENLYTYCISKVINYLSAFQLLNIEKIYIF